MKRYIDEKTGKVVNILEKDEANKIVKILIDYFFSGSTVPAGRLNLVGFLRDFIKLGEIEDLNKIIEYIGEYKKTLKLSKEDEESFEVLYKFFRMYKDLEDVKLSIEDASNYISEMTNKKEELASKDEKDVPKKDKILKVFFDNGFEFRRLAKVACESWENHLKEQLTNGKKEVYVTLEQEIAYQDLLEFASGDEAYMPKMSNTSVVDVKKDTKAEKDVAAKTAEPVEDKKEDVKEAKDVNDDKSSKIDINVQVPDRKEPVKIEIETKKEEKVVEKVAQSNTLNNTNVKADNVDKKEEKIHTIQINPLAGEDDEIITGGNVSVVNPQVSPKVENTAINKPKAESDSLLGLDDDIFANPHSNNSLNKVNNAVKNNENVDKKEEKIHTIQINPFVEDDREHKTSDTNVSIPQNSEEKTRKEQGYTSNIHIFVPGVDDVKEQNNVNPSDVKKATENVDLKESVDFFNNVLDDRISKKSSLLDDDTEDDFRD